MLGRGYSLTQRAADGRVVRAATELSVGQEITTRFARGQRRQPRGTAWTLDFCAAKCDNRTQQLLFTTSVQFLFNVNGGRAIARSGCLSLLRRMLCVIRCILSNKGILAMLVRCPNGHWYEQGPSGAAAMSAVCRPRRRRKPLSPTTTCWPL